MAGKAARQPAGDLILVVRWLALLSAVFLLDVALTAFLLGADRLGEGAVLATVLGVRPREPLGLVGLAGAPLVHADLHHLAANLLALLLCGWLACRAGRPAAGLAVAFAMVCSGLLTWLVGERGTVHVGASGVVFGLLGFLIANAVLRKGVLPVLVALPVLLLYGASLGDMLPGRAAGGMSWEMHLGGFIGGVCASWGMRRA